MSDQSCTQSFSQDHVTCLQSLARLALRGCVQDLRVTNTGEGLILQGQVHTYYAKQRAQHAIMSLTALPIAANQIQIVEPVPCDCDFIERSSPGSLLT